MIGGLMYWSQKPLRDLYEKVLEDDAGDVARDVLRPWLDTPAARELRTWFDEFKRRPGDPVPTATDEELCLLYAASRVSQTLLLGFQPDAGHGGTGPGPAVALADYLEFMTALGFATVEQARFHPFYHEVVALDPDPNPAAAPTVVSHDWPAIALGPLLFARAGVRVRAGSNHLKPGLADASTLYWAFRRRNRPYEDLSHGWGSNSQWRTAFRRDYHLAGAFHFNADGRTPTDRPLRGPPAPHSALPPATRAELLAHRCLVRTRLDDDVASPYQDRTTTPEDAEFA
jgi:hypothetical protein